MKQKDKSVACLTADPVFARIHARSNKFDHEIVSTTIPHGGGGGGGEGGWGEGVYAALQNTLLCNVRNRGIGCSDNVLKCFALFLWTACCT